LTPDDPQEARLTGEALRIRYGVGGRTPLDYALTHEHFADHARAYGKMGGLDRLATVIKAIRSAQPRTLVLAGGSNFVGPEKHALLMARTLSQMGVDDNVKKWHHFEDKGYKIAVLGKSLLSLRSTSAGENAGRLSSEAHLEQMRRDVALARESGAQVVVLLSQNGLGMDAKIAREVDGLDVILSGGDHRVLPEPLVVSGTYIVASGGQGQFVSRLDLDIGETGLRDVRHRLIPIFADILSSEPKIARQIKARGATVIGRAGALLYRKGTLTASWDRLICDAMLSEQGIDIALVPGHRWGPTVLAGQAITDEHLARITALGPQHVVQASLSGADIKALLEQSADAVFSADPFARNGLDLTRAGGLSFEVAPAAANGSRVRNPRLTRDDAVVIEDQIYNVVGWGVPFAAELGPKMSELLTRYLSKHNRVQPSDVSVRLAG